MFEVSFSFLMVKVWVNVSNKYITRFVFSRPFQRYVTLHYYQKFFLDIQGYVFLDRVNFIVFRFSMIRVSANVLESFIIILAFSRLFQGYITHQYNWNFFIETPCSMVSFSFLGFLMALVSIDVFENIILE